MASHADASSRAPHDLAVIIVSTNEAHWLEANLRSVFGHTGSIDLDVVVIDNGSTDGTRKLVESCFPDVRVVDSENEGFSHANNRGLMTCDARYVLFLNPDTEVAAGTFEGLVRLLDERPSVGLIGVRQVTPDGILFPTIRRFPNALRALCEAAASERFPFRAKWLGERELDMRCYEIEFECDWTSGSFMLARREALESAGYLDERFFIFSEETDLCYRIKQAGWSVRHLPSMTIIHHAGKRGANPKMEAQEAFARLQYAHKHFSGGHMALYRFALCSRYGLRMLAGRSNDHDRRAWRIAFSRAFTTAVGLSPPPFGAPPPVALRARLATGKANQALEGGATTQPLASLGSDHGPSQGA